MKKGALLSVPPLFSRLTFDFIINNIINEVIMKVLPAFPSPQHIASSFSQFVQQQNDVIVIDIAGV